MWFNDLEQKPESDVTGCWYKNEQKILSILIHIQVTNNL